MLLLREWRWGDGGVWLVAGGGRQRRRRSSCWRRGDVGGGVGGDGELGSGGIDVAGCDGDGGVSDCVGDEGAWRRRWLGGGD